MSSGASASLTGGIAEAGSDAKRKLVSDASPAGLASLLHIQSKSTPAATHGAAAETHVRTPVLKAIAAAPDDASAAHA
jgi:hypothetical protein